MHASQGSSRVTIECKNYRDDVSNAELDQLLGYLTPWRGRFGILVSRRLRNREAFTNRCRFALQAGRGLVIGLDDTDIEALSRLGTRPRDGQDQLLYERADAVLD